MSEKTTASPNSAPLLRAADVEDVAQARQVLGEDVAAGGLQAVAEAGAVDEEGNLPVLADLVQLFELPLGVDGPELRRERDIDHARLGHVLAAEVAVVRLERVAHLRRGDLARGRGEGERLVAAVLHGAGLVDVDVGALRAEHALVWAEEGGDDRDVGLRAAHQEVHVGVRAVEDVADAPGGLRAVRILSVAQGLLQVCGLQRLQDLRTASFQIIAFEVEHIRYQLIVSVVQGKKKFLWIYLGIDYFCDNRA